MGDDTHMACESIQAQIGVESGRGLVAHEFRDLTKSKGAEIGDLKLRL